MKGKQEKIVMMTSAAEGKYFVTSGRRNPPFYFSGKYRLFSI